MQTQRNDMVAFALSAAVFTGLALSAPTDPMAPGNGNSEPKAENRLLKPPVAPEGQALHESPRNAMESATNAHTTAVRQPLKLPGLVINFEQRCVDLAGSICLVHGSLELIACTKDTMEHESIVVVESQPMIIHAALLLLGAKNGNPAMRRALNEDGAMWVDVPPRGDPIDVFLVFNNPDGKMIERPIGDFITRSREGPDDADAGKADDPEPSKFPQTFLFAGSQLINNGKAPRRYLADASGHVITIVTYGDELLCLPGVHSQDNGTLEWKVDATHLPKLGTKVTLRLRPKNEPAAKPIK